MLTAKTAASASQLIRARPATVMQADRERRSDPSRPAQDRITPLRSPAGRCSRRATCRSTQAAALSSAPRIRSRRAAAIAAAKTAAASRPVATVAAMTGMFPVDSPPRR
jgi:hypothetical protein